MHPVLFRLPPFGLPVYSYGMMLGLSFVAGWWLVFGLGRRLGLDPRRMEACFYWTAGSALLGARLLFFVANPDRWEGALGFFRLDQGGIVAYGGFLASLLYCRVTAMPFLAWADAAVPALGAGLFLTRIGCLLAGCDFGRPSTGPLALRFPRGSPAWKQQVELGEVSAASAWSVPVHPTQLYESGAGLLLLCAVLLVLRRGRRGEALLTFVAGYALLRFLIETLRADRARGQFGLLSTSQWAAIATLLAALGYLALRRRSAVDADPA